MDRLGCWHAAISNLLRHPGPNAQLGQQLLLFWNVDGFHIATSLQDDRALIDALKRHLSPYAGVAQALYRGELKARHEQRLYGMAWTPQRETAEMFATRRESGEGEGVLLRIRATAEMIIAAPSAHSLYLGEAEYLVDPRLIADVEVLEP